MTAPGSLIGFGLLFGVLSYALSVVVTGGHIAATAWLRARGAWVERRAASLAIVAPPLLAAVVTVALGAHSLLAPALGGEDHCPGHGHHLHLCLRHGQAWASQPWAVAAVAGFAALVLARAAQSLAVHLHTRRALRTLARASWQPDPSEPRLHVVPDANPYCFTVGIRAPRIFMSAGAWSALAEEQRAAVLAHERAHLEHGDLWRRTLLGLLALFGAPTLPGRVLAAWGHATERVCDRRAADQSGSPTAIAAALVALARAGARPAPIGVASFMSGCSVVERVEALLADLPDGRRTAVWLGRAALLSTIGVVATVAGLADPLHHLVETLLGAH